MTTTTFQPRSKVGRLTYASLATLLAAAIGFEAVGHSAGYWQIAAFGLGPDLALLYGAGRGLERGQLHPRAVRFYNLAHRFWAPLALAALASLDVVASGYFIGALAWMFHIALDRSVGYGFRTPDGFQRR